MIAFAFRIDAVDGAARAGAITTPRGIVRTPAFMPIGTQGAIKGVHWRDVKASGADIVLGNTYHLMLRPGAERIAALGGLHRFINWPHPILTDSGGFQVMSLSELRKIDDNGVTFRSHLDGAMVALTPGEGPRYRMGVGPPDDILEAVGRGIAMFDCVLPTRNGRHGLVYTRFGAITLRNARHAADPRPLDAQSRCPAARDYARAYLHHLVKANEILGAMLLSEVNLYYYQDLMAGMRAAIAAGKFAEFCALTREGGARVE